MRDDRPVHVQQSRRSPRRDLRLHSRLLPHESRALGARLPFTCAVREASGGCRRLTQVLTCPRNRGRPIEKRVQAERKQLQAQVEEKSRAEVDQLRRESKVSADAVKKLNTRLEMQERAM